MDEVSDLGYFDADELLGTRVWVHTNRTNRKYKRNGMIGVYKPHNKTRSDQRFGYTNVVRLSDCIFDANETCIEKIKETGKRTLCSGIQGTIIETEGSTSGFQEFTFDPKDVPYYYLAGDKDKKKIFSASVVYLAATEAGDPASPCVP